MSTSSEQLSRGAEHFRLIFVFRESTHSLIMAGLDMDYCMIVIDKIINPLTPKDQIGNLVK